MLPTRFLRCERWNVVLFEDLQNAQVCEARARNRHQGLGDACPPRHRGCTFVQGLAHPRALASSCPQDRRTGILILWVPRPERAVLLYWVETAQVSVGNTHIFNVRSPDSTFLLVPVPSLYHCRQRRAARFSLPSGC